MASKLTERLRVAVPLVSTSLNNANTTGTYVSMARVQRLLAVYSTGAMAAATTSKLELFQAKTEAGGSAEAITGLTATLTANTKVKEVTAALASVGTGDILTVTVYKDDVQVDTAAFVKASADDGLNFANAAGLEAAILANLVGVTASDNSTTVTITALDDYTITAVATAVAGTITVATTKGVVTAEVSESGLADGFLFVAPKVTSSANGQNQVTFIMEMKDLPEGQGNVGAHYPA